MLDQSVSLAAREMPYHMQAMRCLEIGVMCVRTRVYTMSSHTTWVMGG